MIFEVEKDFWESRPLPHRTEIRGELTLHSPPQTPLLPVLTLSVDEHRVSGRAEPGLVKPPMLWKVLLASYKERLLAQGSVRVFAWVPLELISLPASSEVDILEDARSVAAGGSPRDGRFRLRGETGNSTSESRREQFPFPSLDLSSCCFNLTCR